MQNATPVSPFRMNTCKSVSKKKTLTTFRMNTYEKRGEGGRAVDLFRVRRHMRHVTPLSPVPSLDCAYFPSPRVCTTPYALQISALVLVVKGDRTPAAPFFHF